MADDSDLGKATRKYIGRLFAARRAELGLTQDEVVQRVPKMDRADYGRVENGERGLSIPRFEAIANALELTLSMIFVPIASPVQPKKKGRPRKKR